MPEKKKTPGAKRERENVNMSEKYELRDAKERKTPSKNHPGLTPKKK